MFDFSGDEVLFMMIAGVAGVGGIFRWIVVVLSHAPPVNPVRSGLALLPGVCLTIVAAIIWNWADPAQVSGHIDYLILFLAGAAAWFSLTVLAVTALGIHFRYDAVEAGNRAAAISIAGAGLATSLIYAGGNIGAGPTIWTTILPAAAASLALGILWFIVDAIAHAGDAVTIDRDTASGIRIAGWAVAAAIVLGRSVAGDWTGWDATLGDFLRLGWPAAVLTAVMIAMQLRLRPSPEQPRPSGRSGLITAGAMILLAVVYVVLLPAPDIGKHVITYDEYMNSR
jgi:hypothetical protein